MVECGYYRYANLKSIQFSTFTMIDLVGCF